MGFESCTEKHQESVRTDSKDRYLSYMLLRRIGNQHIKFKVDIQNNFTTGNNLYPKSCPQTLHLMDKYSKIAAIKMPSSKELFLHRDMPIKEMGGESDATIEVGMIKLMTIST